VIRSFSKEWSKEDISWLILAPELSKFRERHAGKTWLTTPAARVLKDHSRPIDL